MAIVDKPSVEKLDSEFESLLRAFGLGRKRGRPPRGFEKAYKYWNEYRNLRHAGISAWRAKKEVADENHKTPQHISACVKLIEEHPDDLYEFLSPDRIEDW